MQNPWFSPAPGTTERAVATLAFWVLSIVVLVLMFQDRNRRMPDRRGRGARIHAIPLQQHSGRPVLASYPALPRLRVARGRLAQAHRRWLDRRWPALLGYWTERGQGPRGAGRPPISFEWYRTSSSSSSTTTPRRGSRWVITLGEIAVGIGLLLGLLTGIAAFFGALMNMSFLLAGSASTNPVLFTLPSV